TCTCTSTARASIPSKATVETRATMLPLITQSKVAGNRGASQERLGNKMAGFNSVRIQMDGATTPGCFPPSTNVRPPVGNQGVTKTKGGPLNSRDGDPGAGRVD